jgi:hypothetical protein
MKRTWKNVTAVAALAAFLVAAASAAWAHDVPKTKAECLALAEKYQKMAADQEAIVKEHTEMKKEYRSKFFLPKQEREKALADMDKHCDAIIAEAQKLADGYKAMAQWHKMHAEHMK